MRVVAGTARSLMLKTLEGLDTRPTTDRIKETLFNMLMPYVGQAKFLDLFAGSGALGIEALSEGADKCYFVDKNKIAINTLKENLERLKVKEEYYLINKDYIDALNNFNIKFDIIFLDPPYHLNMMNNAIDIIIKNDLLNDGGIIVCEYEEGTVDCSLELIKSKKYGSKNIDIYKK